ncbi:tryptophan--tRNA ligase, partial [Enterobacter hormaechei]|nr:tryptophan--tRNA ligase [Enterobacter hormaechei]
QAGGLGDRACKYELEACLQELIAPMRERRAMYMQDKGELMAMRRPDSKHNINN